MASGLIWDEDGNDITMDTLSETVEEMTVVGCLICHKGPLTGSGPYRDAHIPCCSSHGRTLCCVCYRTTHFVEVGLCH